MDALASPCHVEDLESRLDPVDCLGDVGVCMGCCHVPDSAAGHPDSLLDEGARKALVAARVAALKLVIPGHRLAGRGEAGVKCHGQALYVQTGHGGRGASADRLHECRSALADPLVNLSAGKFVYGRQYRGGGDSVAAATRALRMVPDSACRLQSTPPIGRGPGLIRRERNMKLPGAYRGRYRVGRLVPAPTIGSR